MRLIMLSAIALMAGLGTAQAQDADAGQKVFAQCRACHQVGDKAKNAVGPVLNGLFGREAGTVPGYRYSKANKESGIVWTEEAFTDYIQHPRQTIPGTKMAYPGLKDEQKIEDLIAYLHTFDDAGAQVQGMPVPPPQ